MIEFRPALLTSLKHYSREKFTADLMAGIIVGIVALPLAIAFGIASGVSPEKGIITAIIAGFLTSALGGSRVQIGGPTGAFIVIVPRRKSPSRIRNTPAMIVATVSPSMPYCWMMP